MPQRTTEKPTARTLYDFADYKEFLKHTIAENHEIYGFQSKLAEAAGCQRSFFSQALRTSIHLTPEHAIQIAKYLGMPADEQAYWLDLISFARAGTAELRDFHRTKLDKQRVRVRTLAKRFAEKKITSAEQAAAYYETWMPSAVHILVTIPEFRTAQAIAARLGISLDQVSLILGRLQGMGLIERAGDRWVATNQNLHLPKASAFTVANHRNWRQWAIDDASASRRDSVHYTSVHSLSRADYEIFQNLLLAFLDQNRKRIAESKEEELCVFLCDFFVVDRSIRRQ
ncbi:MAG: TIGR02147 family protein [Cryobacterium sp.]|nr:TIGR02147 family protein [Oligoflexia bacterium]